MCATMYVLYFVDIDDIIVQMVTTYLNADTSLVFDNNFANL